MWKYGIRSKKYLAWCGIRAGFAAKFLPYWRA
jgi:hypothetical protein